MSARLLLAAVAFILLSCKETSQPVKTSESSPVSSQTTSGPMQLVKPSIAVGEKAIVRFAQPLDASGHQYWITLIEAGQVDSQWGAWQYVDSTTREVTLDAAATPGRYEVRLHDRYPKMPHHVVARLALTVTGSAAASQRGPSGDSRPVAATAETAAPVTTGVQVPAADVAAMAASDYGSPSTRFESALPVQRWAQDGGGQEVVSPSAGRRFLIVEFPHTGTQTGQLFYDSRQVFLLVGGDQLKGFAVTTGGASARSMAITPDGRRIFQRDVYASHYAPAPDLPFALAFEVPTTSNGGTLKLGQRESVLSW